MLSTDISLAMATHDMLIKLGIIPASSVYSLHKSSSSRDSQPESSRRLKIAKEAKVSEKQALKFLKSNMANVFTCI